MNILFSFGYTITPSKGGTERVASLISSYFAEQGHSVYYLVTEEDGTDDLTKHRYFLPSKLTKHEKIDYIVRLCAHLCIDVVINEAGSTDDVYILSKEYLPTDVKIITCIHFDICQDLNYFYRNYNYSLVNLNFWQKIFKIVQILRLPLLKIKHTRSRFKRYRYTCYNSDYVVVPAKELVDEFAQFIGKRNIKNVVHIPNPNSVEIADEDVFDKKEKLIIYVGRLSYEKRVDRILKVWKKLNEKFPQWNLSLAGDGDDKSRLLALTEQLAIPRVTFLGQLSGVKSLYEKASVLLLTSDSESFSMVLLEALSYGCYPVIFDFPAAKQLLASDKWGIRVEKHTEKDFFEALSLVLSEDRSICNSYFELQKHLKKFALSNVGKKWTNLLTR